MIPLNFVAIIKYGYFQLGEIEIEFFSDDKIPLSEVVLEVKMLWTAPKTTCGYL